MDTDRIIRVLADGAFHSGEELGQLMSVSRTAVWKQVRKLEDMGLLVDSVKGRGYRLPGGMDLLDKDQIESCLEPDASMLISEFDVYGVVESTNALAMGRAINAAASGYVCTAEQQTAGRGRRGRQWVSPYAGGICLSVAWEFAGGATSLEGLSLATGVVLVEALNELGLKGVMLKWPNDILCEGRKLAGILLEMTGDAEGPCQVVVGIGLNVKIPQKHAEEIDQQWVDLSALAGGKISRNRLLSAMLNKLLPMLANFESQGFTAYRERWQQLDALAGQQVYISMGGQKVAGLSAGVDGTGALLLDTPSGRMQISGGEVSLRRSDDS